MIGYISNIYPAVDQRKPTLLDNKKLILRYLLSRYLPLNVTPAFLKQTTDTAFSLLDEIKKKEMDENIMKPREVKAIQQVYVL